MTLPGLEDAALSPIRRQYLELKRRRPDAILFFRLGDFYETFEEDAELVARVLDITLTSREMGRGERLPMAGIPAHAGDGYVARLIGLGYHVAIAEQIGVASRNGLVPREIVRVITPGTIVETDLLSGTRHNFLASLVRDKDAWGLAYVDVSTGDFLVTEARGRGAMEIVSAELARLAPAECLVPQVQDGSLAELEMPSGTYLTEQAAELFSARAATRVLGRTFGGVVELAGLAEAALAMRAAGALLAYVVDSRAGAVRMLQAPRLYSTSGTMLLDRAARRHLDLVDTAVDGAPTLFDVMSYTRTAMGARLLRESLGQPLLDPARINARLDGVEHLVRSALLRQRAGDALKPVPDLERLSVRAGQMLLNPRECLSLAHGLAAIPALREALEDRGLPPALSQPAGLLEPLDDVVEDVRATVVENATIFQEGVVRAGVSADLDEQRALSGDARKWIADLEQRERERSGVRSARVGYNKVFGYYLEVSAAQVGQTTDYYQKQSTGATSIGEHLEKLGWMRKQTLANAERFVTPELKEMEARVSRARDEGLHLEREIYNALLQRLSDAAPRIARVARAIARVDVLVSLADAALVGHFTRPLVDDSTRLLIREGRHPVVERALGEGQFVPNDTDLSDERRVMLLTGPNMAGKSTYLRQVALIVLLAQAGSFVPAASAEIGVVDRIFTRIGAHDEIAAGRSTFMVEMVEAAAILRAATARSLVILDEVGRGTSTFDGMAIAQAIVEDLHDPARPGGSPKTIFATHYLELTALAATLDGLRNHRVDVLEQGDDVVFLHCVVEGGADRSFGVHVARLAGVPERVTRRATSILRDLESAPAPSVVRRELAEEAPSDEVYQRLRDLDVLRLSPLEAQAELARLQDIAEATP